MRIGVNGTSLNTRIFETFIQLAKLHPEHTFLFFYDTETNTSDLPQNIIPFVITPQATIPLKWRIWYNLKLPSALKKNKADIFISEKFISFKTKIPQILLSPDFTYIFQPSVIDKKHFLFYKKNTPKFLNKAERIVVNSHFFRNEIVDRLKIEEEKVKVIYPEIERIPDPMSQEEKEAIKEKYAEGNEYFIYNGIISTERNLVNLLKAFSFFKKRQRSKMQLLIAGKRGAKYDEFVRSLQSYRFKNEVRLLEEVTPNQTEKIVATAYSMLYVPFYESEGDDVIEAVKLEVPLIVSNTRFLKEYCGDAALYVDPNNFNDIAEKMMLLFKDEQKRKELIQKGKLQIEKFLNEKRSEILFELIEHEAKKNPLN
ncbi:MAG: glycosyltransferase family 1 protein [Ginsengibacter sp.]